MVKFGYSYRLSSVENLEQCYYLVLELHSDSMPDTICTEGNEYNKGMMDDIAKCTYVLLIQNFELN